MPKLKEIPIKGYKNLYNLDAKIISVIIIKETTDKLYASVIVEENINNEKNFLLQLLVLIWVSKI